MISAKLDIQKAIKTRLDAAVSVPVQTETDELPAVEIGEDQEVLQGGSNDTQRSTVTVTIFCRALSQVKSKQIAEDVVKDLTDRTNLLALPSPFTVLRTELVGHLTRNLRRVDGPTIHETIVDIDYLITQ